MLYSFQANVFAHLERILKHHLPFYSCLSHCIELEAVLMMKLCVILFRRLTLSNQILLSKYCPVSLVSRRLAYNFKEQSVRSQSSFEKYFGVSFSIIFILLTVNY